jgi:hypothetical protein
MPESEISGCGPVLICEPQCVGLEHSNFNAALLCSVAAGFPGCPLYFLAEASHLEAVQIALGAALPVHAATLHWIPMEAPARAKADWIRLQDEYRRRRNAMQFANDIGAQALIVASINNTGLLVLKFCLRRSEYRKIPVLAIPHSCLTALVKAGTRRPWNKMIGLRQVLLLPQPRNLRLVALGPSLFRQVASLQGKRVAHWCTVEHPYLWSTESDEEELTVDTVRFGFFGVTKKGFAAFCKLAAEIHQRYASAEFWLVGSLKSEQHRHSGVEFIKGVGISMLSLEEYRFRAAKQHYCIWTGDPEDYRLTASGSFLDALSFIKPGFYLSNAFVDYYFDQCGDIGYLCADYHSLREALCGVLENFPYERYQEQRRNILRSRTRFHPARIGPQLWSEIRKLSADLSAAQPEHARVASDVT